MGDQPRAREGDIMSEAQQTEHSRRLHQLVSRRLDLEQRIARIEALMQTGHGFTNKPFSLRRIRELRENIAGMRRELEECEPANVGDKRFSPAQPATERMPQ
jgi:hypothetical protein